MDLENITKHGFTTQEAEKIQKILEKSKNTTRSSEETSFNKILHIKKLGIDPEKIMGIKNAKKDSSNIDERILHNSSDTISENYKILSQITYKGVPFVNYKKAVETSRRALTLDPSKLLQNFDNFEPYSNLNPVQMLNKEPFMLTKFYTDLSRDLKIYTTLFGENEVAKYPNIFMRNLLNNTNKVKHLLSQNNPITIHELRKENIFFYKNHNTTKEELMSYTHNNNSNADLITLLTGLDQDVSDESTLNVLQNCIYNSLEENTLVDNESLDPQIIEVAYEYLTIIQDLIPEKSVETSLE